jgi:hypothetical protein
MAKHKYKRKWIYIPGVDKIRKSDILDTMEKARAEHHKYHWKHLIIYLIIIAIFIVSAIRACM